MSSLPKAALAILALPGVQSLEREPDGWCCHLACGWTTAALSGGGTIIDTNLKTIRAFVVGAYQIEECEPETVVETVFEPSLADLFAAQSAAIKAEGDAAHASALSTIAAMRSTIDAILTEPEAQPVAAVPVASPKLPRVNRLKRFAVSFTVPGPTGGDLPGWVTVKATDFDSAGAWFQDHRAALGLPFTAQIDTIRTA
jgi:hypothetical protein